MPRRAWVLWLCVLFLVPWCLAAGTAEKPAPPKQDQYELYKLFVDAMDQVERNYVKEVDRRELMEAAIKGCSASSTRTPTTSVPTRWAGSAPRWRASSAGSAFSSMRRAGSFSVLSPLVGTPAYRAGIIAGDQIVEIDGKSTEGMHARRGRAAAQGRAGHEGDADRDPSRHSRSRETITLDAGEDPRRDRARRSPQPRRQLGLHARSTSSGSATSA